MPADQLRLLAERVEVVRLALDAWAAYRLHAIPDRLATAYGGLDLASLSPPAVPAAEHRALTTLVRHWRTPDLFVWNVPR